jgi:4-diphosphocytidyl-2-C-methyl-D-erythritol kinase
VRTTPPDGVPPGAKNLAGVAARLLATRAKAGGPVAIDIAKQIPVAGGMAGGSADAAAALVGCAALWDLHLDRRELAEIAREIGADVPFALAGGTALGTGRGDLLSPVMTRARLHWVLAISDRGLSTPAVFAELDRLRAQSGPPRVKPVDTMLAALTSGEPAKIAAALGNDLQAAAISLAPELRRTLRAGEQAGALGGLVSGSGPTVALLCADAESAGAVAVDLAGSGTCRSVRVAAGPAPGARLVPTGGRG